MSIDNSPRRVIGLNAESYDCGNDHYNKSVRYQDCPLQNTEYDPLDEDRARLLCEGCGHRAICHALLDNAISAIIENDDVRLELGQTDSAVIGKADSIADGLEVILDEAMPALHEEWFIQDFAAGKVVVDKRIDQWE
ncbi:hypothetical protein FWF74_03675 [Candidatus Saccharibacteria bacterium]|nr:hypothetical protein [Candidatus Saccharibacteria bacterium]MCL1962874.1 hypothetical protein [Candidatus Saccharibacteria bacterium]